MDDEQYRQARDAIDMPYCVYGKALQHGYFTCQHAQNIPLGEREALHCKHPPGRAICQEYLDLTVEKSGFVLGTTQLPAHLTFSKAMQVQIGGLQGAVRIISFQRPEVSSNDTHALADIADSLMRLKAQSPNFSQLKFSLIVPYIQEFSLRKRVRRRPV